MSFSKYLECASKILGREIPQKIARYAINKNHISKPPKGPDGWYRFSQANVDELVTYCRTRARSMREELSPSE